MRAFEVEIEHLVIDAGVRGMTVGLHQQICVAVREQIESHLDFPSDREQVTLDIGDGTVGETIVSAIWGAGQP